MAQHHPMPQGGRCDGGGALVSAVLDVPVAPIVAVVGAAVVGDVQSSPTSPSLNNPDRFVHASIRFAR